LVIQPISTELIKIKVTGATSKLGIAHGLGGLLDDRINIRLGESMLIYMLIHGAGIAHSFV